MEIELTIRYEEINGRGREADELRRSVFTRYPDAIWERCGDGHKIVI
jgi:hypothetical protein